MRTIVAAAAIAMSTAVIAKPSVFVRSTSNNAWYYGDIDARVLSRAAGNVTIDQLSKYLADNDAYHAFKVCSLEQAGPDTYVGVDRSTQTEIDTSLKNASWTLAATTPDGRQILARNVLFEACEDDEDNRGAALLVTDQTTGAILAFLPIGARIVDGKSSPSWVLFLMPKRTDELFAYSSCSDCSSQIRVYYDVSRKRIYSEYEGD